MLLIKKLFLKFYRRYIQLRWHFKSAGYALLADEFLKDYKQKLLPAHQICSIHRKGFVVLDWLLMDTTDDTKDDYLSTVDYFKMHPLNGDFSKWIDDKLTLKYLCSGTELDQYMPEYYYTITNTGKILCLVDCLEKKHEATTEDLAALLRKKGSAAFKLISGSIGAGFIKAEYKDDLYFMNGESMDLAGFCKYVKNLRNYLVTEYLRPHEDLAAYCPDTVNCLRYLVGRVDGKLVMLKGYIRFGTKKSGFVENYNTGGVLCYLDQNGTFSYGNIISDDGKKNLTVSSHPDTGTPLCGSVPLWDEIVSAATAFDLHFPMMDYLGIDFVVTSDRRVKVLEINSLTSLDGFQLDGPVFKTDAGKFFHEKIK